MLREKTKEDNPQSMLTMKLQKLNKKGESGFDPTRKTFFFIIVGVVISIIVMVLATTFAGYQARLTFVPGTVKAEFVAHRFINNPDCFAFEDSETKRVYSGIVDLEKFDQEQMQYCYITDKDKGHRDYNFRLWLRNTNKTIVTNNYFYRQKEFTLFKQVLVRNSTGKTTPDELVIYVQGR